MPLPAGVQQSRDLMTAGFSDEEVSGWQQKARASLSQAGFAPHEVDQYFGTLEPDMKPVAAAVQQNFAVSRAADSFGEPVNVSALTPEGLRAQAVADQAMRFGFAHAFQVSQAAAQPLSPAQAKAKTQALQETTSPIVKPVGGKPVQSFDDALSAGLQMSVSGLLMRGKAPDITMAGGDDSMTNRVVSGVGQVIGDLPFMVAGGILGGGAGAATGPGAAATAGAGAFGLPAGLRATLMDAYEKGDFHNFADFWERASGIIWQEVKGEITGAATSVAGYGAGAVVNRTASAAGPVVPLAVRAPITKILPTAAEIETLSTVGSALEGHAPSAQDFLDNAALIAGLKFAHVAAGNANVVAQKMRDIYRQTGLKPDEVVDAAHRDPTIAADMVSDNQEIPRAFDAKREEVPYANIRRPTAPTFYSEFLRQVANLKVAQATPEQWMGTIRNLTGVKRDEIEASGVIDWLQAAHEATKDPEATPDVKGLKLTRDHIASFIQNNGVQVTEHLMGEPGLGEGSFRHGITPETLPEGWTIERAAERYPEPGYEYQLLDNEGMNRGLGSTPQDAIDDALTSSSTADELGVPKYREPRYGRGTLRLPGSHPDEYRELVITLPQRTITTKSVYAAGLSQDVAEETAARRNGYSEKTSRVEPDPERPGLFRIVEDREDQESANFYGDHYGIPNNLAHTRFSFRNDTEGRRVLFVEELQSDWAEQGRSRGFRIPVEQMTGELNALNEKHLGLQKELADLRMHAIDTAMKRLRAIREELRAFPSRDLTEEQRAATDKLHDEEVGLHSSLRSINADRVIDNPGHAQVSMMFHLLDDLGLKDKADRVTEADRERSKLQRDMQRALEKTGPEYPPKAPFITKTDAWVSLLFKRLIRYAAEHGFERVAWTTGKQQNSRYGLSGHVERIEIEHSTDRAPTSSGWTEILIEYKDAVRGERDETRLRVNPENGVVIDAIGLMSDELHGKRMEEIFGREMADKILKGPNDVLTGHGLEVGGEGMRQFYDKIVPNVANDVLKKLGGGRVGPVTIPLPKKASGEAAFDDASLFEPTSDRSVSYRPHETPDGWVIQRVDTDGIPGRFFGGIEEGWTAGTPLATKYPSAEAAARAIETFRADSERYYVQHSQQLGFDVTPQMVEKAMAGMPLFNIDATMLERLRSEDAAKAAETYGSGQRVSPLQTLRRASEKLDSGEWTRTRFESEVRDLLTKLEDKRNRETNAELKDRARGKNYVEERLLRALRQGDLDEKEVDLARWLLAKNPALATELGISIRTPTDSEAGATARYNPVSRVIALFKGTGRGDETIVHEILHHSERMLPPDVRDAITQEWAAQYAKAYAEAHKNGEQTRIEALRSMADAFAGKPGAYTKMMGHFEQGQLTYADYALFNPSEFWAVNGSRILSARWAADTWGAKARQWYRELIQKVREILGLTSDAPVLQGLEAAMKVSGDMPDRQTMLSGTIPIHENIPRTPEEKAVLDRVVQLGREPWWRKVSFDKIYTKTIDRLFPIKMAVDEAARGNIAGPEVDAYRLERLTAGVFGKGAQFIKLGTFDFDTYQTVGRSYQSIMDMLKTVGPSGEKIYDLDGFRAYMVSRRAIELEDRQIEHGIPIDAARAVVAAGQAKFEPVFQARLEYRRHLLDYLEKSGILDPARRSAMEELNAAYVPFYRFFDGEERANTSRQVRNPIKTIKGSLRQVIDPIESDIKDTFLFINLAEKNASRKALVALGPQFAEKIPNPVRPIALSEAELQRYLNDHGIPASASGTALEIFRAMRSLPGRDEIVVYEGGRPATFRVNPDVAEAFNQSDRSTAGILSAMLNAPASLLRAGVTLSPDFFPRNLIRDALSAFIYAGSNPVKTAKGFVSIVRRDDAFQSWMKSGGPNATLVAMDRNYIREHLFELSAETGLSERAWNVVKTPIEILRVISEIAENSTRLGMVRDQMRDAQTKAQMQALAYIAREGTVDFARRGSDPLLQKYTHMTAFMNPGIQGIDRMFRALVDNPTGTIAKSFAAITIPSLLLWWANKDDKRIQEIPRWERDLFWLVPTEKHIFRIPKPFELGVLFGTLPERLMDEFVAHKPDALKDIDNTLMSAFGVNLIPTITQPAIEQFANRNLFTGHSLVSATEEKLLPEYQYNVYTTELAKKLGQMFGAFPGLKKSSLGNEGDFMPGVARALTNPTLIENYVRAWSGGLGTYALKIADAGLRKAGVLPDPVLPTDTLADVPFVKAFVVRYPSASAEPIQDFYDTYNGHKKVWDTIMVLAQEGNAEAVAREMRFDPAAAVQLTGIRTAIGEHAKLIRDVYKNPDMSRDDKRQLIDTMYMRMIDLSETGLQMFREVEKQMEAQEKAQAAQRSQLKAAGFNDTEINQYMGAH
jgi:hypothetical protein